MSWYGAEVLRSHRPLDLMAAAFCFANPLTAALVVTWEPNPLSVSLQFVALAIMAPIVAALQIVVALLVRRLRSALTASPLLIVSAGASADYARVAFTADLSSSSTAGVGLILYPFIAQAIWVLPIVTVAFVAARYADKRGTSAGNLN
jgi:hypothetical protein